MGTEEPNADTAHRIWRATINNKIYALGGYSGSILRTVEEYDPATDTWIRKADMPTPRRQLIVVSVNNKIYATGGVNFSSDPNNLIYSYSTEEYNPATNVWTSKTQPPFSYTRYTVASLHNKVYALSDIGEMAEYDPLKDRWIIRPPLSTHRFRTGLASVGGRLFSIGGGQNSSPVSTVEEYDPETQNWAPRASIASPRVSVAVGEALTRLVDHQYQRDLPFPPCCGRRRHAPSPWFSPSDSYGRCSHDRQWSSNRPVESCCRSTENYTHSPLAHSQNIPLQPTHGSFDHPLRRLSPK